MQATVQRVTINDIYFFASCDAFVFAHIQLWNTTAQATTTSRYNSLFEYECERENKGYWDYSELHSIRSEGVPRAECEKGKKEMKKYAFNDRNNAVVEQVDKALK